MTWYDTKQAAVDPDNPGANEQIPFSEWNAMVTYVKDKIIDKTVDDAAIGNDKVLKEFDLFARVPVAGLAKQREEIFLPGRTRPILLPRRSQGLFLVQRVRDEAHRFAITYHRKLRRQATLRSALEDIPGVGVQRRKALLRRFGSLKKVKQSTLQELEAMRGLP